LPVDVGSATTGQVTIEQILEEKKTFDLSLSFEKLGVDEGRGWRKPSPSSPTILSTLPTKSNILSVHMLDVTLPGSTEPRTYIAATTADRRLNLVDPLEADFPLVRSYSNLMDSPLLDLVAFNSRYVLAASMSGKLMLYDTAKDSRIGERKDHSKYIVKIATWIQPGCTFVATAGWDSKVLLYKIDTYDDEQVTLGEPIASLTLPTIPETLLFIQGYSSSLPVLIIARRDSTFLYYYSVPGPTSAVPEIGLLGKQNLAPLSNAWIAFSPSDVQICPTDPSLAAVATSSTPHMKLIVVRLLVPPGPTEMQTLSLTQDSAANPATSLSPQTHSTQASQARAELITQDKEEAAMVFNISTLAPQTQYSVPRVSWRPDGSGLYVSSDDGVIRGFEASTGKLVSTLSAHDPGFKIRCLWSGRLKAQSSEDPALNSGTEYLISGGFDQRLIVWESS
jgi:WD40 repeat protein